MAMVLFILGVLLIAFLESNGFNSTDLFYVTILWSAMMISNAIQSVKSAPVELDYLSVVRIVDAIRSTNNSKDSKDSEDSKNSKDSKK